MGESRFCIALGIGRPVRVRELKEGRSSARKQVHIGECQVTGEVSRAFPNRCAVVSRLGLAHVIVENVEKTGGEDGIVGVVNVLR